MGSRILPVGLHQIIVQCHGWPRVGRRSLGGGCHGNCNVCYSCCRKVKVIWCSHFASNFLSQISLKMDIKVGMSESCLFHTLQTGWVPKDTVFGAISFACIFLAVRNKMKI